ncbi:MAG TPA: MFS transporter [Streptosporangiaceae bacterium]|jgi:predicted MFS family arabinose efflux permease
MTTLQAIDIIDESTGAGHGGAPGEPRPSGPGGRRPRPALLTRALLLRLASAVGMATSFYLLLSVVPLFARSVGAGVNTAGLSTTALTLAGVAGELVTPWLAARFGYRQLLAAGLILLGAPALLLLVPGGMTLIIAVCVVRGFGFGAAVVAGGALTASIIPAERRGEGLALLGVAAGLPSIAALPLGVWLAAHAGYAPVIIAGAVASLAALPSVPGLPQPPAAAATAGGAAATSAHGNGGSGRRAGVMTGLRTPALARPYIAFSATCMAAGVIVTFLPLAAGHATAGLVALALLIQPAASTLTRWLAGRYGDRHGPARLIVPSVVLSAAGVLALALSSGPAAVIGGAALFGAGFGVAQNASLALMYARVSTSEYGTVSAIWNLAYDAGMGLGAAAFGAVAARAGSPMAFSLLAAVMLAMAVPALRDTRGGRR